jgi:hypothetical protein
MCSPLDALEHYVASISECRQLPDPMWLAGALDGYICTIVILMQLNIVPLEDVIGKDFKSLALAPVPGSPAPSDSSKVLRLADDRVSEALQLYSRHVAYSYLEVDLTLRLARLYRDLSPGDVDVNDKVLELVMRAAAIPGLNGMQQVECVLEGGLICKQLGLGRKNALFLYISALMSAENNQLPMANDLVGVFEES